MGSCVSSVHSYGSKNGRLAIPPSPIKEKPANGHPPINGWSATTFKDLGSKDETFFDSRPCLDSDCEDDFFSVRGDFTPSSGNTPVHRSFLTGNPQTNKTLMEDETPGSVPEPPATRKKMKLAELFRQNIKEGPEDQQIDEQHNTPGSQNTANRKVEVKTTILDVLPSGNGTPYISGTNCVASSERTDHGDSLMDKENPMRSLQCCLPSLVSRGFNERKKKKTSPAIAVNG